MKPHRIIITRDVPRNMDCDYVFLWPYSARLEKDAHGQWNHCNPTGRSAGIMRPETFRDAFGFLPRKGSKKTYRIVPDEVQK